jgi:hypothetical protein
MIGPLDVLQDVIKRFEKIDLDYFLVGSLAAMYYSRPRFTNDIDLVVEIKSDKVKKLIELFPIEDYYCPPFEIIRDEVMRMGSFNLIHHGSGIKIDIVLQKNTEFFKSEFLRRKKVMLLPQFEAYVGSAEDIILKKLEFYREGGSEKHLQDIREILAETEVDKDYLEVWVQKMFLLTEYNKI